MNSRDGNVAESRGAYGLRLTGLPETQELCEVPPSWPRWDVSWHIDVAPDLQQSFDSVTARLRLEPRGMAVIERSTSSTSLLLPEEPRVEAFIHPLIGTTAVVTASWLGRHSFHASSFVHAGHVWGVVGDREQGKSSTIAWCVANDVDVFADDLLVVDGDQALAGPRCLDLRETAAAHFGMGRALGVIGTRARWRVPLRAVPPALPLGGWVRLRWAEDVSVRTVDGADRLRTLVEQRGLHLPEPSSAGWLRLLALPMVELTRPRDWSRLDEAMSTLLVRIEALTRSL